MAHRLATRLNSELPRRLGSNVLGVGIGLRTCDEQGSVEPELTLKVYVRKKWKQRGKGARKGSVRRAYFGYVSSGKKRKRVWIRTDVHEMKKGAPHALDASVGITKTSGAKELPGSLCCLVRRGTGETVYALSCKHVFGAPVRTDGVATRPFRTRIGVNGSLKEVAGIGDPDSDSTSWDLSLSDTSHDAAIAALGDGAPEGALSNTIQGIFCDEVLDSVNFPADVAPGTRLLLRSGQVAKPKTVVVRDIPPPGLKLEGFVVGNSKRPLRFDRTIAYEGLTTADTPKGGDSGSALILPSGTPGIGTLVGLHHWGNGDVGVAQLAEDVFFDSAFGEPLELAIDLDG